MAYKRRFGSTAAKFDINTALQNPEFKKLVLSTIGEAPEAAPKKANFLERVLAMPMALGSIPDALARVKQGQNPLSTYLDNIGKGIQQTATGEKILDLKTTQDLLKENGILSGSDKASKLARGALGFVGDVVLDPTTYLTFGTGKLAVEGAKVAGKGIAKKLGQEGLEKIGKSVADDIAEKLATEGAEGAVRFLTNKGIAGAADLVRNTTANMAKDVTMKFAGKELLKDSSIAKRVIRGVVNPLAGAGDVLGTVGKKYAPEATQGISDTFNRMFNARGYAQSKGLGGLYDTTKDFTRDLDGTIRRTLAENEKLLREVQKLPSDIQANMTKYIQGTMNIPQEYAGVIKKVGDLYNKQEKELLLNNVIKQVPNITKEDTEGMLRYLVNSAQKSRDAKTFTRKLKKIIVPFKNLSEGAQKAAYRDYIEGGGPFVQFSKFITDNAREKYFKKFGIKAPASASQLFDFAQEIKGVAKGVKPTTVVPVGQPIPVNVPEQLRKDFESLLNFNRTKRPYAPQDVFGYTKQFIEGNFGESAPSILRNDKVIKDIERYGAIKKETLNSILSSSPLGIKQSGLMSPEKYLQGSELQKTFPTQEAGEMAGVVYSKNAPETIAQSLITGTQSIKAKKFADRLRSVTDDGGNNLFRHASEFSGSIPKDYVEMKIKGMEGFYAPKEAAEIVKNYTHNFLGDEGTNTALRLYDGFLKSFKKSVTAFSPGFIGYNIRNMFGDINNMMIGGFGLRNGTFSLGAAADSFKMGAKAIQFEDLMKREGREAAVAKFGKEVADLYDNGLKFGNVGAQVGQVADEYGKAMSGFEAPLGGIRGVLQKGQKGVESVAVDPFRKREDLFRFANLWDHYKQGNQWDEAARMARQSSLDYGNLTAFEKNIAKRFIPFYSFMRQNLELQLSTLGTNPGRIMTQQKLLKNISQSLSTDEMTEEDWNALPDWLKEGLSFAVAKDGSKVDIVTGFGDPTSAVNQFIGGDIKSTLENLMNAMSPAAKIPIEKVTGTSLYTKQRLEENTSGSRYKDYPEWVKKIVGYREIKGTNAKGEKYTNYRIDPNRAYWLENLPYLAPYNTMTKRLYDAFGETGDPKYLVNLLTGARIYQKDLVREEAAKEKTENERLNKLLIDFGIAQPRTGVYLNPSLNENSPEVIALLASMGYTPKRKTEVQKEKAAKKQEEKELYLNQLLSGQ